MAAGDLLPQSSQSTSPHFKYFLKLFSQKTNLGKDKEKGNSKQGCRLSVQSEHNTKGFSKTSNYNQVKITKRHMNFTLSGTLFTLAKAWNLPKCLRVNVSSKYQNIYSQEKNFKSTRGGGQGKLRYSSPVAQINKSTLQRHTGETYKRDSHTVKTLHTKHGCIIGTNSFLFVSFPYFPGSFPNVSLAEYEYGRASSGASPSCLRVSASKTQQSRAAPHSFHSSLSTMHRL